MRRILTITPVSFGELAANSKISPDMLMRMVNMLKEAGCVVHGKISARDILNLKHSLIPSERNEKSVMYKMSMLLHLLGYTDPETAMYIAYQYGRQFNKFSQEMRGIHGDKIANICTFYRYTKDGTLDNIPSFMREDMFELSQEEKIKGLLGAESYYNCMYGGIYDWYTQGRDIGSWFYLAIMGTRKFMLVRSLTDLTDTSEFYFCTKLDAYITRIFRKIPKNRS